MVRVVHVLWLIACLLIASTTMAQKKPLNDFAVKRIKLRGVYTHDLQGISQASLEARVNAWRLQEFPQKRLTLNQLQDLAFKLSKFYQDVGFSFVAATVPKQKISRGIVIIQVREDKLSDVQIRNVSKSQRKTIKQEFQKMIGKPVFKPDLEEPILLLNDNPNREVFAYFSRGKNKGETRLNLNVKQTNANGFQVGVNNHGSPSTGTDKWWLSGDVQNPFGWDDVFHVDLSQSLQNEKNIAGTLSYQTFSGSRGSYTYNITRNQYQLGDDLAVLKLSGEYTSVSAKYRQKTKRTFSRSASDILGFEYRNSELTSKAIANALDQSNGAAIFSYQNASTDYQIIFGDYLTRSLQSSIILLTQDSDQTQDDALIKFNGFFQSGKNIGSYIPGLNTRFTSKLTLQYSPQVLPSADKKPLSGASAVRAYESGVFSADDSVALQLQLVSVYPSKIGKFEPYGFYDHAFGIRKSLASEVGAELSGYGVGLKYGFSSWLNLDVSYAVSNEGRIGILKKKPQSIFMFSLRGQVF